MLRCSTDSFAVRRAYASGLLDETFVDPLAAGQGVMRRSWERLGVGQEWKCRSRRSLWKKVEEAIGKKMKRVCGRRKKMGASFQQRIGKCCRRR